MHDKSCEEYQILISGFLDGELDNDSKKKLEDHTKTCSKCSNELNAMRSLITGTAAALRVEEPPQEAWDNFLDNIYNRLERKTGWLVFLIGAIMLSCYGLTLYIVEPWGSYALKFLLALPFIGLGILFVSVLRQRLKIAKTDRYSREVHR